MRRHIFAILLETQGIPEFSTCWNLAAVTQKTGQMIVLRQRTLQCGCTVLPGGALSHRLRNPRWDPKQDGQKQQIEQRIRCLDNARSPANRIQKGRRFGRRPSIGVSGSC
jgi:hypothetical protein